MPRFSHPTALLFVDSSAVSASPATGLSHYAGQIIPKIKRLELAADQDGVIQISATLSAYRGLQSLHIVAAHSSGRLQLGTAQLTLFNLDRYGWELQQWGESLSAGAKIIFYQSMTPSLHSQAFQVPSALLNRLHLLTGAQIVVSSQKLALSDAHQAQSVTC